MVILAVANVESRALKLLEEMVRRENIKLILGREISYF